MRQGVPASEGNLGIIRDQFCKNLERFFTDTSSYKQDDSMPKPHVPASVSSL